MKIPAFPACLLTVMSLSASSACSAQEPRAAESAAWSIKTAEVLFTASRGGTSDLYVLARETGEVRRLTSFGTSEGRANAPRVSPDGTMIAFQIRRGTDYGVHVMDLDGGQSQNLSRHPEYDVNPAWAPDGSKIAFMSTRGFELGSIGPFPGHIYARDLTSDSLQQVTRQPLTSSFGPSDWSPDGSTVLIARSDDEGTNVYELDVSTGSEVRLTAGAGSKYSAVYAHSGDLIAFHAESDGESQIMVLDLRTREARAVTDGPGLKYSPQWSPDDAWLMFTASDDGVQYDLRAVRASDGHVIEVVAGSGAQADS
jgi:TolB protein